jgi:hypothetical protein
MLELLAEKLLCLSYSPYFNFITLVTRQSINLSTLFEIGKEAGERFYEQHQGDLT